MIVHATKRFEFDTAHRLPNHEGLCKNIHGHRYALEVTVQGELCNIPTASDEGMVIDFKELGQIVRETIIERWDHALLLHKNDPLFKESSLLEDQLVLKTDQIPTAECMAVEAFQILEKKLDERKDSKKVRLARVRLYETPSAWVEILPSSPTNT